MDIITLRSASVGDKEKIYEMLSDLEEAPLNKEEFNTVFTHNLADPNVYYLVAYNGSTVVGFASLHIQQLLHHTGKAAELQEMYVTSTLRGQGIGKKLIEELKSVANKNKCKVFEVTCNMKRKDTHRFYIREGLQPTHYKFVRTP